MASGYMTPTGKAANRQLPAIGALYDLAKTKRSINDYAKASPLKINKTGPSMIQNLRTPRR